jgi:hypothetical protein
MEGAKMFTRLKKPVLTAVAAAAVAPALLLAGVGTAQADALNGNPEVLYNPHPGGLTATVKNWTKFSTKCTYTADGWIVRNVNLSAFGSQDLEFPGVPLFHPWDVKVNCDNGKSTSFVYWY